MNIVLHNAIKLSTKLNLATNYSFIINYENIKRIKFDFFHNAKNLVLRLN